jgi:hypothetical protein
VIHRYLMLAAATLVVALLAACDGEDDWNPDAQFAPSLRPAFGARVSDGQLQIWTGSRCHDVTRLALAFEPDRAELVLIARAERPATVEYLTLGGPYPGLEVSDPLPEGFDWRNAESVRISVYGGGDSWGSSVDIADIVEGSDQRPNDTYFFEGVGWLNPEDVATQDGKTFLATCTPDPAG